MKNTVVEGVEGSPMPSHNHSTTVAHSNDFVYRLFPQKWSSQFSIAARQEKRALHDIFYILIPLRKLAPIDMIPIPNLINFKDLASHS
jgi:hypothetical protein